MISGYVNTVTSNCGLFVSQILGVSAMMANSQLGKIIVSVRLKKLACAKRPYNETLAACSGRVILLSRKTVP